MRYTNFFLKKPLSAFLNLFFLLFFILSCGSLERRLDKQRKLEKAFIYELKQRSRVKKQGTRNHIPYHFNSKVQRWIAYYQGRGRKHMERYLSRSSRYLPRMKEELKKRNLPEDLVYIVFVESGFNPSAHSRANAVGYWQFISQTARAYGLTVNGYIDERKDPILSTRAASRYFKKLYNMFGDWYLAMAAYNTGENRVKKMIKRYKTRDFWRLCRKRRAFWRETKNYVPKFLAARLIAENPEKFGFINIAYESKLKYKTYPVTQPMNFKKLAKELNISHKEIHRLNPKFQTHYVLPFYNLKKGRKRTYIRLPIHSAELTSSLVKRSFEKGPYRPARNHFYYRVRKGDVLSKIARRFQTSSYKIQRLNKIRRPSYLRTGQILRIPKKTSLVVSKSSYKAPRNYFYYRVQRGDSLSKIARRYNVSSYKIQRLNRIKRPSYLRIGQILKIPKKTISMNYYKKSFKKRPFPENKRLRLASQFFSKKSPHPKRYHTVKRGENLSLIAEKYQVSVRKLVQENSLRNPSSIFAGERLIIPD